VQPPRRKKQLVTKVITVPDNLQKGCDDFNAGRFYESHEHFEEIWQYERGACRDAYKGLIQVAAAFVNLSRGKYAGAERLLRTSLGYLAPYRETGALGFDIEGLCRDTEKVYERLVTGGKQRLSGMDLRQRPHYSFDSALLRAHAVRDRAWGFDEGGHALPMEITVAA